MTCATPDITAATALCEATATLITAGKREGIYCSSLPSTQGRHWEDKGLGLKYPPSGDRFWICPYTTLTVQKLTFPKQLFRGLRG